MENVTWGQWKVLKDLSMLKNKTPTYRKDWANRVGIMPTNQTWTNVISILSENNIIEFRPWISNFKIMSVNVKKLDKFIENTNIYKEFKNYIYFKQLLVAGV